MAGELIRREALERIIQRAAELQAGEQDIGEGLTEPELLALGQDVGIPSRSLRQALLEEQTRPPAEARGGVLAWLVGPGRLSAQRVVAGEPAVIDRALGTWMQEEELLQVKRRYADHTTWEPKVGARSEEHTSELQSQSNLVCRLLLEKKKKTITEINRDQHQI